MAIELTDGQRMKKRLYLRCMAEGMRTVEAALILGVTQRCVQIGVKRYRNLGDASLVHGNKGRRRVSAEYEAKRARVLDIFQNTRIDGKNPFAKITYSCFADFLLDEFGIKCSVSWIKKQLNSIGYFTPEKYKSKKHGRPHLFRERKEHFGELVQADGTSFDWFRNGHAHCIQGFVDDATGMPVGLHMTKNECLLGYNEAFRTMAAKHGLPMSVYPDRLGVFFDNSRGNKSRPVGKKNLTQFGRAMDELGIDMFPAYTPQAKGRIERFWRTLKQRLPCQLMYRGIKTVDEASRYINEVYIPKYVKKFCVPPKEKESFFVRADMGKVNAHIRAVFPGKTDSAGVFSLKGYRFCCRELVSQKINICLSETDGLWIERAGDTKRKRYKVILCETDTTGCLPEVYKLLIEKVFLQNAKPKFREVYYEMNEKFSA